MSTGLHFGICCTQPDAVAQTVTEEQTRARRNANSFRIFHRNQVIQFK